MLLILCVVPVFTEVYLNKWAIHVPGGERHARDIAERHGFYYEGRVSTRLQCQVVPINPLYTWGGILIVIISEHV